MMVAIKTDLITADGLFVYDLAPQASELWTVAGPAGVDPATIDIDDLPAGFRVVTEHEWESLQDDDDQDDEPPISTIVLCPCTEWVRENMGVDFSGVDTHLANLAADAFMQELEQLLIQAGFNVVYGKNDLLTFHGWNGHRWFLIRFGVAATYDRLTDEQNDLVYDLIAKAQEPKATLEKFFET